MKIYTYACLARKPEPNNIPSDGLIEATAKDWVVEGLQLRGFCDYARKLTDEELRQYNLVCIGSRIV